MTRDDVVVWTEAVIDEHVAHLRRKGDDASCVVIEYLRARASPSASADRGGLREKVARLIEPNAWMAKDRTPDWDVITLTRKRRAVDAVDQSLLLADAILSTASSGWQPIETAPKDGTEVLIAGQYLVSGVWDMAVGDYTPKGWRPFVGEHSATHWQPLPVPPALQQIEG